MQILLISGLSGAGKTRVANILEDMDYYCVDNMPIALLPRFVELCSVTKGRYDKVGLVVDTRERGDLGQFFNIIEELESHDIELSLLFIEANNKTLVTRFKESRRPHPLQSKDVGLEAAIEKEREVLSFIRERADKIISTDGFSIARLQKTVTEAFSSGEESKSMMLNVKAFGYKYGLPTDADLVFDVRFLPNPFYVEELRNLTGMDNEVYDFVMSYPSAREFLEKLTELFSFLIPKYLEDGRYSLTVGIGCTGGRHRSVTIARALAERLSEKQGISVQLSCRDIDRNGA